MWQWPRRLVGNCDNRSQAAKKRLETNLVNGLLLGEDFAGMRTGAESLEMMMKSIQKETPWEVEARYSAVFVLVRQCQGTTEGVFTEFKAGHRPFQ